jgi:molybdopterin-guanine dinucleotide biosynthesis protein A
MVIPAGPEEPGAERAGPLAALVLAGGLARRLGGADKPGIAIGGQPMIAAVAAAAAGAGARQLVVVGPPRPGLARQLADRGCAVAFTTEHPPGAGPVPALRAGLQLIAAPWLILLAADLPFLRDRHLRTLLTAAAGQRASGAMLTDDQGRPQWLASCWRSADLAAALAGYQGSSLGGLLGPLRPVEVTVPPDQAPPWLDCDTPQDLTAARALGTDDRQRREADDEHTR